MLKGYFARGLLTGGYMSGGSCPGDICPRLQFSTCSASRTNFLYFFSVEYV